MHALVSLTAWPTGMGVVMSNWVMLCLCYFLEKNLHFQPFFFAQISTLKKQNFQIFAPKTPHFPRKTRSPDPTFGNLRGTYPSKKVECPPPRSPCLNPGGNPIFQGDRLETKKGERELGLCLEKQNKFFKNTKWKVDHNHQRWQLTHKQLPL